MNPPYPHPSRDDTLWEGIYWGVIAGAFLVTVTRVILEAMGL